MQGVSTGRVGGAVSDHDLLKLAESDYVEFHEMIAERKQFLARIAELEAENKRLDGMLREACRRWSAVANRSHSTSLHAIRSAGEGYQELARWAERSTP